MVSLRAATAARTSLSSAGSAGGDHLGSLPRTLWVLAAALLLALAVFATGAAFAPTDSVAAGPARTVLIVAPHPDDDLLYGAGVAANALAAGDTVKVVYMTNGDWVSIATGLGRQGDAVEAQTTYIGTHEDDLIFLGYPDNYLLTLYQDYPGASSALTTKHGQSTTYGARGLGLSDYHTYRFGSAASYNRPSVLQDLESILETYRPDDIYTTSAIDTHSDHATTHAFVRAAIAAREAADSTYTPTLHTTFVWWQDGSGWPAAMDPQADMVEPPEFSESGLVWSARESLPVPAAMQSTDTALNPKYKAIVVHSGTGNATYDFLTRFVHRDEVFWTEAVPANRPPTANAGPAQTVLGHTLVHLDGRGSSDPDGEPLGYSWTQTAGPTVTLSDASAAQPSFTAPAGATSLGFELVVNDGHVGSSPASVTITVATDVNIAALATVTASSQNSELGELAVKAVDGSAEGYPGDYTHEWATLGEQAGAWLRLVWSSPYVVNRIVLNDRPNANDHITAATLHFSDGSTLMTGALPNDGSPLTLDFPARAITSVQLDITATSLQTANVGLAEIEVYGHPPTEADTFTITPSAGPHGTISPDAMQTVTYGSTPTFTITPDSGYGVADVLVDGASVGAVTSYKFPTVSTNHTIAVTFALIGVDVTAPTGTTGSYAQGHPLTVTWTANFKVASGEFGVWAVDTLGRWYGGDLEPANGASPDYTHDLTLNVPVGGPYSVAVMYRPTPGSGAWVFPVAYSPGSFAVTSPSVSVTVSAPTGTTGSYAVGDPVSVTWDASPAVTSGEYGVWAVDEVGHWYGGDLWAATGSPSYTHNLSLNVPVGGPYSVAVMYRPVAGSGAWVFPVAYSPGSFAVN